MNRRVIEELTHLATSWANDLEAAYNGGYEETYQSFEEWFWNELDPEVDLSVSLNHSVNNVEVTLQGGGPTVWIDCHRKEIFAHNQDGQSSCPISYELANEIFDIVERAYLDY